MAIKYIKKIIDAAAERWQADRELKNFMASQVAINSELHKQAKIKAAQKGVKIQEWYDAVVRRALGLKKEEKQPV